MSVVFIFRRDLRWADNIGLTHAYEYAKRHKLELIPIFIFNDIQINPKNNPYYGVNTVRFMIQCLESDIASHTDFYHVKDNDLDILRKIKPAAVFFNRDHTPFARRRDQTIIDFCNKNGIHVHGEWSEYSLFDINDKPYRVYNAFLEYAKNKVYPEAVNNENKILNYIGNRKTHRDPKSKDLKAYYNHIENPEAAFIGGRSEGIARLKRIRDGSHDNYGEDREFPVNHNGTTHISAYLKYGCISIREAYHAIKSRNIEPLLNELFWRAYYDQIAYHFPHVLDGQVEDTRNNTSLNPKNDLHKWKKSPNLVNAILNGKTGIPIVDAAVMQLVKSGYMHNRMRMTVCMLASRILDLNWRIFEKWFAQHLIDYHPSANNGGWQWSVQYRFVLNPWVQQQKYDKDAIYIRRWLPEFNDIPIKDIHTWYDKTPTKPILGRKLP